MVFCGDRVAQVVRIFGFIERLRCMMCESRCVQLTGGTKQVSWGSPSWNYWEFLVFTFSIKEFFPGALEAVFDFLGVGGQKKESS